MGIPSALSAYAGVTVIGEKENGFPAQAVVE